MFILHNQTQKMYLTVTFRSPVVNFIRHVSVPSVSSVIHISKNALTGE